MYFRSKTIIGAGLVACSLAMPAAQAQMSGVLEEIIVTAQKREENIQEVPISITRMSGDRLNARFTGGEDILALASAAPGLHVETSNGRLAPRFYMRGLGNADFTQAASQPVSIVFDDVVMEKVALKSFPLFDMDRIEVIRGPQGTLFGRNTTAGIIKVDTRRPTEETEGYVKAAVGNMGIFNVEAAVGGALVENTLLARVSMLSQNMSDWIDNGYTGESDFTGGHNIFATRLQFLWTPTDSFSVWLMHQRQDQDGSSSMFRANVFDQGSNKLNENYDRDTVYWDGGDGNPGMIKSHGTTLKLDWDLDAFTITSITSYQDVYDRFARADIDGGYGCLLVFACGGGPAGPPSTPYNPAASPFVGNIDTGSNILMDQFTQELRLASNSDGAFNYQVGYFYFEDEFDGDIPRGPSSARAPTTSAIR
jgi:iron complex outermembrane receptor protein